MKGRKKRPPSLRLLHGTGDRTPARGPHHCAPLTDADIPDFIAEDETAAAEWRRIVEAMPPGFLAAADVPTLAVHCSAWSLFIQAQKLIRSSGATAKGSTGQRRSSAGAQIAEKMAARLAQTCDALGIGPSARIRFGVTPTVPPDDEPDGHSPLDDLLRG